MGRGKAQQEVRTMRAQMRSPSQSVAGRDVRVRVWQAIARGLPFEETANEVGVGCAVGTRWFRDPCGMTPISLAPISTALFAISDTCRDERSCTRAPSPTPPPGHSGWSIGHRRRSGHPDRPASRSKVAKLAANEALRDYVQDRPRGHYRKAPDAEFVAGPPPPRMSSVVIMALARIGVGRCRGVRSRSPSACI
jgi:hypothetical protein